MRLKNYLRFINEDLEKSDNKDLKNQIESSIKDKFKDLKLRIIEKIIDSLKTQERKVFDEFITAYIQNDEKNKIQGLINDAEVNEFYLTFSNDINEILSDLKFFEQPPSKINVFNLDTYIVKATLLAVKECIIQIKEDSSEKKVQDSTEKSEESTEESDV